MHIISGRFSRISIALSLLGATLGAHAQNLPITADQKATASQVAQAGIPVADLAPNAPDSYVVKSGDTLWSISGLFLKSPWRWPELWGMNLQDIRNPHRIYPGQQLFLDKSNGRAVLRTRQASANDGPPTETIRVSPRTRSQSAGDTSIPTLASNIIEPFLAEPLIVDAVTFAGAPRIVAAQEGRVLLSRGDRAYARGVLADGTGKPLSDARGEPLDYRVFRNATPLKDPVSGAILGYEAQFVGKAELVRGESIQQVTAKDGKVTSEIVPATIDIIATKEEMRTGDRLVAEPARSSQSYAPHAPATPISGQIVSVYGSAVTYAAENQVVVVNRGTKDGLENGHVMAILKDGQVLQDRTDSSRTRIKLPNERNGLLMVFRTFDQLSYALVLQITDGVKVGDRFTNPN
ncbi:LysM peptidoglycan-binding domain-containing protein [Polaromonas sp.]|uniref:LysM peptidoglycan-binding domain-containing protein n=1 Tax=Polaromonas sp. TaxID=1869339 RepID=UPI003BAAFAE9